MSEKQYSTIQIRRGSNAAFNSVNPVLASGEPAFAIDVGVLKIGDGVTNWTNLAPITSGNIGNYALLDSPHFTGIPTAPTANSGTNTTQIATTAFVRTEVANLIDSAPALLDTLNELAAAINDDANFATTITNNIIAISGIAGGGHNHTVSNITDFNSGVSGLLPSFSEGTGVQITDNTLIDNTIVIDNLHTEINELSLEPQGFVNRLDSVISFNDSTRTFTIAPTGSSYDVYIEGVKVTKTTAESIVIPSSTALNYLHFDTDTGLLSNKNTAFNFDTDVPIAYIHWNSGINQSTFFGEERHGIRMDSMTHKWIHNTFGMQYINGLSIGGYTLLGDGSSNSHAQIDISDGTLYQEDIIINITDGNNGVEFTQQLSPIAYIPVYYHSGTTGQWVRDTATPYPLKYDATRALYNLYSGGTWTTPNVPNNRYFAMWIVATNDINDPILAIMGQREDSSIQSAENNNNWSDIDLTNIPTNELRPLYRLIFLTNDTFTNTPKSSLQSILDLRKSIITSTYGVSQNDHGNLFGLGDDDHYQYVHINESRTIEATHTFTNGLLSNGNVVISGGTFELYNTTSNTCPFVLNIPNQNDDVGAFQIIGNDPDIFLNSTAPGSGYPSSITHYQNDQPRVAAGYSPWADNYFISRFNGTTWDDTAFNISRLDGKIGVGKSYAIYDLDVVGSGNFSNSLYVNDIPVSVSGHTHTTSDISGLIGSYATIYTGDPETQSDSLVDNSLALFDYTNGSVALRINDNNVTLGAYGAIATGGDVRQAFRDVLALGTAATANTGDFAPSGHTHSSSDITNFNNSVSGIIDSALSTDIIGGTGISVTYDSLNNDLIIGSNGLVPVINSGVVTGSISINAGINNSIQTLGVSGAAVTFTKGNGWPTASGLSTDVVLKINSTASTAITWSIVNEWYNQPAAGALSSGVHLFLLRGVNTIIEGHYIGSKT